MSKSLSTHSEQLLQPASYDNLKRSVTSPAKKTDNYVSRDSVLLPPQPPFDLNSLATPLETLVQAQEDNGYGTISSFDCVEAYNLISNRLRSASRLFNTHTTPEEQLKELVPRLVERIHRDLIEGLDFSLEPRMPDVQFSVADSFTEARFEEEDIQSAVEASLLCQAALSLASTILSLPGIYTLFTGRERSALLDPIIGICHERQLTIPSPSKQRALAFLCLQTEGASSWVSPAQVEGVVAAIGSTLDSDDDDQIKRHASKTMRHFLVTDPIRWTQPLSVIFPKVLVHLAQSNRTCQVESTFALCAFATAKLVIGDSSTTQGLSTEIHDFLEYHGSRKKSVAQEFLLPATLRSAMQKEEVSGPMWALVSVAAMVVLRDAEIFGHPKSIRVVLDTLRYSSRHKLGVVRRMHTEVWKWLIWALSRTVRGTEDVEDPSEEHEEWGTKRDTYERAFKILTQEVRLGVGSALACVALQDPPATLNGEEREDFVAWNVREVVGIVKVLMKDKKGELVQEGFAILSRIMSGIGSSEQIAVEHESLHFAQKALINGAWLRMAVEGEDLDCALDAVKGPDVSSLRPLTEREINAHWQDLAELWAIAVQKFQVGCTPELLDQLTTMWQALLLCRAQLTQGQTHLTGTPELATHVAGLIMRSITPTAEPAQRAVQLALMKKWWNVLCNVFDPSFISSPAELVLAGIIDGRLDLRDQEIARAWEEVCYVLVRAGVQKVLDVLRGRVKKVRVAERDEEEVQQELRVTRTLWGVLGTVCVDGKGEIMKWEDMTRCLSLPFHCPIWNLDEAEEEVWVNVCDTLLTASSAEGQGEVEVAKQVLDQVEKHRRDMPTVLLIEMGLRTSRISVCRKLLPEINEALQICYQTSEKETAARAMEALGKFCAVESEPKRIASLEKVQESVVKWLVDQMKVTEAPEHVKLVEAIYLPALEALRPVVSANPDLLQRLESLFLSVFKSTRDSLAGPDAFMDFWHSNFEGNTGLVGTCPAELFGCVKGYGNVCGRPVADDSSLVSSSPSTVISDSQSPVSPRLRMLQQEYSSFADFSDLVGFGFQVGGPSRVVVMRDEEISGRVDAGPSEMGGATPKRRQSPPSALRALREYGSMVGSERNGGSGGPVSPFSLDRVEPSPSAGKRRIAKRHLTEADLSSKDTGVKGPQDGPRPVKRTKTASGILSSPVVPESSSPLASRQESWDKKGKGKERVDALPPSEPDDYDSWEAGMSQTDIQQLTGKMDVEDDEDEESNFGGLGLDAEEGGDGDEAEAGEEERSPSKVLSPTVTDFAYRSRRRERSQTAPELDFAVAPPLLDPDDPPAQPLRRHHSSGSSVGKERVQLEALQNAYAAVVESGGVSQMDVDELLQLKRLASMIGETVDDHIYQQFEKTGKTR